MNLKLKIVLIKRTKRREKKGEELTKKVFSKISWNLNIIEEIEEWKQ